MDFLGAAAVGILVIVLDGSVSRIGQINLIGIDIIELGEGQRCLVAAAAQVDLDVIAMVARGTVHLIDNLERILRIDHQLDIRADALKLIATGGIKPIDDIVDVVAGILEKACLADALEMPMAIEAEEIGILVDMAAFINGFLQAAKFVTSKSSQATRIEPVAGHK